MLFIFGQRTARIGKYTDNDHICYPCKAYDREILIYRDYFHFCLIPVFPIGATRIEMHCRNCGDQTRSERIVKQYEGTGKAPFYLYSAIILSVCLAIVWFYWNGFTQKQKLKYVERPVAGDMYTMRKETSDGTTYYFLRINEVSGDSVMAYQSNLEYGGFVSSLADDDYFVKADTLVFKKKELKEMLERGEIYAIKRGTSAPIR